MRSQFQAGGTNAGGLNEIVEFGRVLDIDFCWNCLVTHIDNFFAKSGQHHIELPTGKVLSVQSIKPTTVFGIGILK